MSTNSGDRPTLGEIVVTEPMLAAGAAVFYMDRSFMNDDEVIVRLYRAMRANEPSPSA